MENVNPDKKVAIILVNWCAWLDTVECIQSILNSSYANFQIIVCDNGSTDCSIEHIRDWAFNRLSFQRRGIDGDSDSLVEEYIHDETAKHLFHPLLLLEIKDNLGFSVGSNVGIRFALKYSRFDFVWLLNNDTTIDENALLLLVSHVKNVTAPVICGATVLYSDNPSKIQVLGGVQYNIWTGLTENIGSMKCWPLVVDVNLALSKMDYVYGASMFVSSKFIENIGLLSEDYFLYYEELDWCTRALRKGGQIEYEPGAIVYHKGGSATGTRSDLNRRSLLYYYNILKSRVIFSRKFHFYTLPSVLFMSVMQLLKNSLISKDLMILKVGVKGMLEGMVGGASNNS